MTVKCIACKRVLNAVDDDANRPEFGTQFRSIGNSASKVTNDVKGNIYAAVLCDVCVSAGLKSGDVRKETKWKK